MARSTQKSIELGELIRRSEASRLQLGRTHAKLKRGLDIPSKLAKSVRSSPLKWVGGSMVAGLVGSLFLGKKKPKKSKASGKPNRGFMMGSLALMITVLKPFVKIYATRYLKDYLKNQLRRGAAERVDVRPRSLY